MDRAEKKKTLWRMILFAGVVTAFFYLLIAATMPKYTTPSDLADFAAADLSTRYICLAPSNVETYPGRLYTSEDFAAGTPEAGDADASFETCRVVLPLTAGVTYGITGQTATYAQRVYVNGQLLHETGSVSGSPADFKPETDFYTVYFTPRSGETEIIVQHAWFNHIHGAFHKVYLAQQQVITRTNRAQTLCDGLITGTLLEDAAAVCRPILLKNRNRLDILCRTRRLITADREALLQVLINLCINSNKHISAGVVTICASDAGDDAASFTVCDTGSGIAPEDLPHIFERGYSGNAVLTGGTLTTLRQADATAMGMAESVRLRNILPKGYALQYVSGKQEKLPRDTEIKNHDDLARKATYIAPCDHTGRNAIQSGLCIYCGAQNRIYYDLAGGSVDGSDPTCYSPGYVFLGWICNNDPVDKDHTAYALLAEYDSVMTVTLTAQWRQAEPPVLEGLTANAAYCESVTFTVSGEKSITEVKVGDTVLTADASGRYTLRGELGTVTVTASDEDGQTTSVAVAVYGGHAFGAWRANGNGTHSRTCSRDESHTEQEPCSGGTATCKEKAACSVCGEKHGTAARLRRRKDDTL